MTAQPPGARADFDLLVDRLGILPNIVAEADDMAMLRLLVCTGTAIGLAPPIVVRDELQAGILFEWMTIPGLSESFYAMLQSRRFQNPLVDLLREAHNIALFRLSERKHNLIEFSRTLRCGSPALSNQALCRLHGGETSMEIAVLLALAIGASLALGLIALETAMLASLAAAIAALMQVLASEAYTIDLLTAQGAGQSLRMPVISLPMIGLVAFIGWIVLRFARTYRAEEPRRAAFTGWLAITLAAVLLFVIAGNLVQSVPALIATSFGINRLLLFYPGRAAAQRAARKHFIT